MDLAIDEFKVRGLNVIEQGSELLIKVRYPFQAGNRDYFMLNSQEDFLDLLENRSPKDSMTIFTKFEVIRAGIVSDRFVEYTLSKLKEPKHSDWLVITPQTGQIKAEWYWVESLVELEETLLSNIGKSIRIMEDPEYLQKDLQIHTYFPDEDNGLSIGTF